MLVLLMKDIFLTTFNGIIYMKMPENPLGFFYFQLCYVFFNNNQRLNFLDFSPIVSQNIFQYPMIFFIAVSNP